MARKPQDPFYFTAAWRKETKLARIRADCQCQRCGASIAGKYAHNTHHRYAFKDHPELRLLPANLQALCHRCHGQLEKALLYGGCDVDGNPTGKAHPWNSKRGGHYGPTVNRPGP